MKILYFDDYHFLYKTIQKYCKEYAYIVDFVQTSSEAQLLFQNESYDLLVVDINSDYQSAIEFIFNVRKNDRAIPIIATSPNDDEDTKLLLLDKYVDDFYIKPFNWHELMLKIKNLYYRSHNFQIQIQHWQSFGAIKLNYKNNTIIINDKTITLRYKEFLILKYLLENIDKIISKEELLENIWDQNVNLFSNAINVHIFNLRRTLKKYLNKNIIKTIRGQGIILDLNEL